MGKSSKKRPSYSNGTVTINGNTVANVTAQNGNVIGGSYNMTAEEKNIYDGIQKNLASSLENLYTISDETKNLWNKELDAYKSKGIKEIENIYNPMVTSLKNDIAARFGNFDNSVFMDNLNNIVNNKADAVAELSDSLLMKQDELYYNEIANRMNYVSLLSGLNTTMNNTMLNYLQMAASNAKSGNDFNLSLYDPNSGGFKGLLNNVSSIASVAAPFIPSASAATKVGTTVAAKAGSTAASKM